MHRFIENAVLSNAINAGLATRNEDAPVYGAATTDAQKAAFRESIRSWLRQFGGRYCAWEYDIHRYCDEIGRLKALLEQEHGGALHRQRLAFGVCQKLVGVYLKYLWLLGDASKKPAAPPLDSKVIEAAKVPGRPNWTEIATPDQYREIVDHVRLHTSQTPFVCPVVWEAETWTP